MLAWLALGGACGGRASRCWRSSAAGAGAPSPVEAGRKLEAEEVGGAALGPAAAVEFGEGGAAPFVGEDFGGGAFDADVHHGAAG
ncbi:MAG: pectate lyase, partial [Acidobacteriota bacterium]